jgi:hypothetical protein
VPGPSDGEAARLAATLQRLGLEVVVYPTAAVLLCRAPGHPYVAARLRQVGIPVRSAGSGDGFVVDVVDRRTSDRLAAVLWTVLCAV